jgi:hypothetical protein
MPSSGDVNLGGWSADEMTSTLNEFSGVGGDAEAATDVRFVRGVVRVVRSRHAGTRAAADPQRLSVFLLRPPDLPAPQLKSEPMLDSGATPIAGWIWLVNPAVVSGKGLPLTTDDANAVFGVVVEQLQMGGVPAVVVDPRLGSVKLRYYRSGLACPDEYEVVDLQVTQLDIEQITDVINRVYVHSLRTPDAQPSGMKLWEDADKYWPHADAEDRVQAVLKAAFIGAFRSCKVHHEVSGYSGRADLHIVEQDPSDPSKTRHLVVLELKVLRTYSSKGGLAQKADEWVYKGVLQAAAYKKERGYEIAVTCCFDMRKTDDGTCMTAADALAKSLAVSVHRWYVFSSSERWREVDAATSSAGQPGTL